MNVTTRPLVPASQAQRSAGRNVADRPVRIAFVITGVTAGGAEAMLIKLLSKFDPRQLQAEVWSLRSGGEMESHFRNSGFPLLMFDAATTKGLVTLAPRLRQEVRRFAPDVIQGWMYHGNLAANLAARFAPTNVPVLWNIRHTLSPLDGTSKFTRALIRLSGVLSATPERIINNSEISALQHESDFGYPAQKRLILPNGFDTALFKPSDEARLSLREELGIPHSARLVGILGRFHRQKNHQGFFEAIKAQSQRHPGVHYALVGADVNRDNATLVAWAKASGADRRVHMLGHRNDVAKVSAALDILVCCSFSEGFPNVVGEAMSSGVPCIVTDTGASAEVVADTGLVVPVNDQTALDQALGQMLTRDDEELRQMGQRARSRIQELYSIDAVAQRYIDLYRALGKAERV